MGKRTSIESVSQAVKMLCSGGFSHIWSKQTDATKLPEAVYPMGLWFRGQANEEWKLRPGVFRSDGLDDKPGLYIDETSTFYHFKLRQPRYHQECQSTFDWLTLMQHHGLPTRLLDWTESILVGLYFAVAGEHNTDHAGRLFALDARKLNQLCGFDMPGPELAVPEEFDATLRAEMSVANRFTKLLGRSSIERSAAQYIPLYKDKDFKSIVKRIKKRKKEVIRRLRSPVGVFPKRMQGRMIFQSSMFTLHGGKRVWKRSDATEDLLPTPIHLEEVQEMAIRDGHCILESYIVPQEKKQKILRDLQSLGIHEGSLFPESEHQSKYVRKNWTFFTDGTHGDVEKL